MQEPIREMCEPSDAREHVSDINAPSESVKLKRKPDSPVKTPCKKLKKEATEIGGQEEKTLKPPKVKPEKVIYVEPPRAEVLPDRTNSDFYCKVCDAHMNSIQVWESHIQGKRHLKNVKKETSAPVTVKKEKEEVEDVSCLYYIDTTGAQSPPSDYITTVEVHSPSADLIATGEDEAESPSSEFVHTGETRSESPSVDASVYERPLSPADSSSRHSETERDYSQEPASSLSADSEDPMMAAFQRLNTFDRFDYLRELSDSLEPQSDSDVNEIKSIIAALYQSIVQYEIRQLPFAAQQKLAKQLFRGK